jgi:hypothetical protein
MAKRARGSTIRPGQRARLQRAPGSAKPAGTAATSPTVVPATAPAPAELTPEELARAEALEAQIVADEKAAETTTRSRERGRRSVAAADAALRPSSIAAAAAHEYDYVARDLRRILIIGGGLVVFLLLLWVVVTVTGFGPL